MSRALDVLRVASWWAVALLSLVWWAPSICSVLFAWAAGRARFWLVVNVAAALREVGAVGAARAAYRHELRRCERQRRAIAERRGW